MGHFETCPDKMKTFAAIVLAFAAVAVQADPEFKACAGFEDNSYVDPWKLTINPDPIVAKEGASVSVHFDATVLLALIPAEDCKTFAPAGQACALPLNPGFYETRTPTSPSPWSSQRSPPSSSHSSQERSPLRLRPCSMTEQSTSASRTLSKLSPIKRKFQKQTFVCLYIT